MVIHQPIVREIAFFGEDKFYAVAQYLTIDKKDYIEDEQLLSETSNFQMLQNILLQTKDKNKKTDISTFFSILFTNYQAVITPQSVILTSAAGTKMIDAANFEVLQEYLKDIFCVSHLFMGDNQQYNIDKKSKAARRIKDKIMKARQKIAAQKSQEKGSMIARYISILLAAYPGSKISDYLDMTLFQLLDTIERFNLKIAWDIDLKTRLAGGTPKEEVKDWTQDLYKN